jgi:precorrin-6Y C5,15-methyltransferase (decarboxylating)
VTNVATLESLSTTYQTLKEQAGAVEVLLMSVARSVDQLETVRLESVNPTFLLTVRKPEKNSGLNRMNEEAAPGRQ